ncbi:MAG: radical SAM/SPASM domain-containing protein [Bacteroidales bacterium]
MRWKPVLYDKVNLLHKLTPQRFINVLASEISYQISVWFKRPKLWAYPSFFSVEPNNTCNLACPECPVGSKTLKRKKGYISKSVYQKIINSLSQKAIYLTLYFQGEPFLHPEIYDMINYASQKKLYVATSTNAHSINEENARKIIQSGLDRLIISLDGTDQETYSAYRKGGDITMVISGIQQIVKAKKELKSQKPIVEIQFLVLGTNEHQIKQIKQLSRELKADQLSLKSAQVSDYQNGNPFIPKNPVYSRYRKVSSGEYALKTSGANRCHRMWSGCVFTYNGDVVPCCFDKDAEHIMGNIVDQDFASIWRSGTYLDFRQKVFTNRSSIAMCRNCTEGIKK